VVTAGDGSPSTPLSPPPSIHAAASSAACAQVARRRSQTHRHYASPFPKLSPPPPPHYTHSGHYRWTATLARQGKARQGKGRGWGQPQRPPALASLPSPLIRLSMLPRWSAKPLSGPPRAERGAQRATRSPQPHQHTHMHTRTHTRASHVVWVTAGVDAKCALERLQPCTVLSHYALPTHMHGYAQPPSPPQAHTKGPPRTAHTHTQHSTAQHSTAQHSTAQHSTAQHSTAQHSTAQHSTAQHSTAQHMTLGSQEPQAQRHPPLRTPSSRTLRPSSPSMYRSGKEEPVAADRSLQVRSRGTGTRRGRPSRGPPPPTPPPPGASPTRPVAPGARDADGLAVPLVAPAGGGGGGSGAAAGAGAAGVATAAGTGGRVSRGVGGVAR
jgi:hypothetical protein